MAVEHCCEFVWHSASTGEAQHERTYPNDFLRAIPHSASLAEVLLLMFRKTARHVPGPTTLHTRGAFCGFILNRYLD